MKLRNPFKRKSNTIITEGWEFAGHTFRVLDPKDMDRSRQKALHSDHFVRDLGLEPSEYIAANKTIIEELNMPTKYSGVKEIAAEWSKKAKEAQKTLEDLNFLMESDHSYKPFIKSASTFILIDDENQEDIPFGKYYDLKMELCNRHREIEDFFLRIGFGFHQSTTSSFDISALWAWYPSKIVKVVENRLLKRIQLAQSDHGSSKGKS